MATDGQIIITKTIYDDIKSQNEELLRQINFESIGEQLIRGKKIPQELFKAHIGRMPLSKDGANKPH